MLSTLEFPNEVIFGYRRKSGLVGQIDNWYQNLQAFFYQLSERWYILFFFLIFIYLAALGLSCCIWGLFGQHSNSLAVACSLSSSTSCGILVLWPEIKPCSLHWQVRFLTTDYRGSPKGSSTVFFVCFNYFWLCWLLVALRGASSPCGEWGLLCLAVLGLPIAVTSLAAEHKL